MHKAGFVNIIGRPNVGKSTLMNQLVGEKLSIITSKAQTTRQRILGMVNGEDHQIVFSDTPGIIFNPQYQLHQAMIGSIKSAFEDADVLLFIAEIYEKPDDVEEALKMIRVVENVPRLLLINKIDQAKEGQLEELTELWKATGIFDEIIPVSALAGTNIDKVFASIMAKLPEHPAYYDKENYTDRSERFMVSEIIREKILMHYQKEIPYSTQVVIDSFKEDETIDRIRAVIYVERDSQKNIIIGKNGTSIKRIGVQARRDIEEMVGKQVYLELHVKVKENWRNDPLFLKRTGYDS